MIIWIDNSVKFIWQEYSNEINPIWDTDVQEGEVDILNLIQ